MDFRLCSQKINFNKVDVEGRCIRTVDTVASAEVGITP
jgi:hypothetical protein